MRTTRRIHVGWTLAAAALASVATVLALPGGGGAVTGATPDNTGEPRISGSAVVGATLSASQGSWAGVADVLRVPVGAVRPGRGPTQRLRLCRGRRCHHDALRRRHGGRRPPAPRPRHRLERRRLANGRLERDRTRARRRHGPTQERPGARTL